MNIDPQLVVLVQELGAVMGFENLALDAEGACAVRFDGRTVVNLQCHAGRVPEGVSTKF